MGVQIPHRPKTAITGVPRLPFPRSKLKERRAKNTEKTGKLAEPDGQQGDGSRDAALVEVAESESDASSAAEECSRAFAFNLQEELEAGNAATSAVNVSSERLTNAATSAVKV